MTPTITYIHSDESQKDFSHISYTYIHSVTLPTSSTAIEDIEVPVSVFNQGVSGLEALTLYLKGKFDFSFSQIGSYLNRDERTIADSYHRGVKKLSEDFVFGEEMAATIPLILFQDRVLGVLEVIAEYLREEKEMRFCDIAFLLGKNDRTIWTAHNRAKKKRNAQ